MTVQILAAALIRVFEGVRLTSYQDSGGVWTIGLGHTEGVGPGQAITYDQAELYFQQDAGPLFTLVEDEPLLAAAAYVSFGYNCGKAALEAVLEGRAQIRDYIHDRHGNVLAALVARRGLEAALIEVVEPKTA